MGIRERAAGGGVTGSGDRGATGAPGRYPRSPLRYLAQYKLHLVGGVLTLLGTNALAQATPWVVKWTVDAVEQERGAGEVRRLCLALLGLAVGAAVFRVFSRILIFNAGRDAEYELRKALFARLCQLDAGFYRRFRAGDLMSRLTNDLASVRALFGPGVLHVSNTTFAYAVGLPLMLRIDPLLTLLSLLPYAALLVGARAFARGIYQRSQEMQESLGSMTAAVQEDLAGIRELKNHGLEDLRAGAFGGASSAYLEQALRLARWRAGLIPFVGFGAGASMVIALWLGGQRVIDGRLTLGDLVGFNLYLGLLAWPTMAIGWMLSLWHRGMAAWHRLTEILEQTSPLEVALPSSPGAAERVEHEHEHEHSVVGRTDEHTTRRRVADLDLDLDPDLNLDTVPGQDPVRDATPGAPRHVGGARVDAGTRGCVDPMGRSSSSGPGRGPGPGPGPGPGAQRPRKQAGTAPFDALPDDHDHEHGTALPCPPFDLELRGLSVSVDGTEILHDVSFHVPAGTLCAVVGRVGCGKSTLADALCRLVDVPPGALLLGGRDVTELPVGWVREQVAYAPQSAFLFSRSIRDNLLMGLGPAAEAVDPQEADDRVAGAVRAAGLTPDLERFPDGLDTVVGERGLSLSGGQRQRVALARALVSPRPVLVLDDSLSSVDAETERTILAELTGTLRGRTAILISHRLAALRHAQQVVVLERGAVAERGTHEELLAAGGLYAELYRRQLLREMEARP